MEMNSVENPRLTAAVTAYMSHSGDVNERMRVALSAADDVARAGEVSDAAVEAATRAYMDHYGDGHFNRCDAAVRASYSEWIRSAIKAALPFMATQVQTSEFSDAAVERLAKVYRDAAAEGIDEPGWDNLLPVYKAATRRGLRAVFRAAVPFGATPEMALAMLNHWTAQPWAQEGESYGEFLQRGITAALAAAPSAPEPQPDARVQNETTEAWAYLARVFKAVAPQCQPLPDLMGLCTQIDNYIAGTRSDARVQRLVAAAEYFLSQGEDWGFVDANKLNEALAPFRQPSGAAPQAAQDATALHGSVRKESLRTPDPRAALVTAARAAELALLSGCTTYNGRPTWLYTAETFSALTKWLESQS